MELRRFRLLAVAGGPHVGGGDLRDLLHCDRGLLVPTAGYFFETGGRVGGWCTSPAPKLQNFIALIDANTLWVVTKTGMKVPDGPGAPCTEAAQRVADFIAVGTFIFSEHLPRGKARCWDCAAEPLPSLF